MADPRLPTDVLIEVLIRLPVKSILKLMCVSKSWCDLIRSPIFIHKHSKFERKQRVLLVKRHLRPQSGEDILSLFNQLPIRMFDDDFEREGTSSYVLFPIKSHSVRPLYGQGETFSFHDPDFPQVLVSPNLSIPVLDDLDIPSHSHSSTSIHGPCNGLVCIAFENTVFLCNPALREFKLLPPLRLPVGFIAFPLQFGFGFDPITGAYKVIQISDMTHEGPDFLDDLGKNNIRFDLYNSASNSWKQIVAKVPDISCLPGYELLYNGSIHWFAIMATNSNLSILCFDVSTDAFRLLDFHDDFSPPEGHLRLMEYDDSLAMVRYSGHVIEPYKIEIWVMKEYGVKESWTKQFVAGPYCVSHWCRDHSDPRD